MLNKGAYVVSHKIELQETRQKKKQTSFEVYTTLNNKQTTVRAKEKEKTSKVRDCGKLKILLLKNEA